MVMIAIALVLWMGSATANGKVELLDDRIAPEDLPAVAELPDPFRMMSGNRVATQDEWTARRKEIIDILLHYEYGHMPPAPSGMRVELDSSERVFDGAATLMRMTLCFGPAPGMRMAAGIFVPNRGGPRFPVIEAVEEVWGKQLSPVARRVIERGYAFAGFQYHDLDGDNGDRGAGVYPLYPDYDWRTLAVWAWGAMRLTDYVAALPCVDAKRIALTGHSRCGKTALLAAALDERIALAVPHCSGAGGAGCYRISGKGTETLMAITLPTRFHYWFAPRLALFAGKEDRLPFDQHFLKALIAPRWLLSLEALGDLWANPLGAQQTHRGAQPVFDFLGAPDHLAAHYREGGHDAIDEDWEVLLDFADHAFDGKALDRPMNARPFPEAPRPFSWTAPDRP